MAAVRSRNTKPELVIRKGLHELGFRYRLHVATLPGRPDITLPKYKAVIFINGCFWHAHHCGRFRFPVNNAEYWLNKLNRNAARDRASLAAIREMDWRSLTIWECSISGKQSLGAAEVVARTAAWLLGNQPSAEI